MKPHIFISYSTKNATTIDQLRKMLELHQQSAWVDYSRLMADDDLDDKIEEAIVNARYFIVVVSAESLDSDWVQREVKLALAQKELLGDDFSVIPVVLPGVGKNTVKLLIPGEIKAVFVQDTATGLDDAMPEIFTALHMQLPAKADRATDVTVEPIEELVLKLTQPHITEQEGIRRVCALAELGYHPAHSNNILTSKQYNFTAPFGAVELEEIRWYVESYFRWPTGVFKTRAKKAEQGLLDWGKQLFDAAFFADSAKARLDEWRKAGQDLRFSVQVDFEPPEGTDKDKLPLYRAAASDLLALPWEILHDGIGHFFQGAQPMQVRRRLPKRKETISTSTQLPIRVLLLSPRPEITKDGQDVGYLDHRSSAMPLIQAMDNLGQSLVKVDILHPPTFGALKNALKQAKDGNDPYEIVHFDGHGVYDKQVGLGALCFEDARDSDSLGQRLMQLVHAKDLAAELRHYGVPLIYLDACQTAQTKEDPQASVAAALLEEGVASVVAMSHSVLVETARRFVQPFYKALAEGQRVGDAMLVAQNALYDDQHRFKVTGAGDLSLQDWFVPVLYQEADDPQLFTMTPGKSAVGLEHKARALKLGKLPAAPTHSFVGRSRLLLQLERLLQHNNYAVIQGSGGMGKTTMAVELTRWLVRCEQFERAAFISVESHNVQNIQGVLDIIGHQLCNQYTAAQYGNDIAAALQPIELALNESSTLIVIDNMESVLPDPQGIIPAGVADVSKLLKLGLQLLAASPNCRLIFTSREALPSPFNLGKNTIKLGRLGQHEAIELVEQVMQQNGWQPPVSDNASTPEEVAELVETVNCHPRALVLLAKEVAHGVNATTQNLAALMHKLEAENKGDRENSLYASVELSLRRLPEKVRTQVNRLAVFHGGGHLGVMAMVMEIETDDIDPIAEMLVDVGMAELMPYNYLRLDPALPAYLKLGQTATQLADWQAIWVDAMTQLVDFLYGQMFEDNTMAANLTLSELPNLLALLDWQSQQLETDPTMAEAVSKTAIYIEQLLADLGRPQALARAVAVREQSAALIPEWGKVRFENERLLVERLLQQGQLQPAFDKAQALLEKAQNANYSSSDYDLAIAHMLLGRVLESGGQPAQALTLLIKAQRLFEGLGQQGERMAAVTLTEQADCLRTLGQLDEAVKKYQQAIEQAEKLKDFRGVAVGKMQLATVFMLQGKYTEAIAGYEAARAIFEQQNDPTSVATAWHQLGVVYEKAGDNDKAETAYRQSLEIEIQNNNKAGQASSLGQLGNFYDTTLGQPEEAITFYRQAADIAVELGDLAKEGTMRNNIANTLVNLKRYDEARSEILRAIECKSQFGHAATPWNAFAILQQIETAQNNPQAATNAWTQARDAYLAYRQQGGYAQTPPGKLADNIFNAITQDQTDKAINDLTELAQSNEVPDWVKTFTSQILIIINGARDTAIANDSSQDFDEAAELLFFIKRLDT